MNKLFIPDMQNPHTKKTVTKTQIILTAVTFTELLMKKFPCFNSVQEKHEKLYIVLIFLGK